MEIICALKGSSCTRPYFFSHTKGTKYCPVCREQEAARSRKLESNRNTWEKHKDRYRPRGSRT
jgi:uncharacterized Zn finger protein (UPF0148 family)